jgi:hypothetical protein
MVLQKFVSYFFWVILYFHRILQVYMNFWNLNENEKPKNTEHSVGLEFGPRPGTVGPAQRLFQPGQPKSTADGVGTGR